jgi:hypothetical protein
MSLVVITDRAGQVIAAAIPPNASKFKITAGILPLSGQKLHQVELPHYMVDLAPHEQLRVALEHCIPKGSRRLQRVKKSGSKKSRKGG